MFRKYKSVIFIYILTILYMIIFMKLTPRFDSPGAVSYAPFAYRTIADCIFFIIMLILVLQFINIPVSAKSIPGEIVFIVIPTLWFCTVKFRFYTSGYFFPGESSLALNIIDFTEDRLLIMGSVLAGAQIVRYFLRHKKTH